MLFSEICLLTALTEMLSEEPLCSWPLDWDHWLPSHWQETFPINQDWSILQHPYLCLGSTHGVQLQEKQALVPVMLVFPCADGSALLGIPNNTTKTSLSLWKHMPGSLCQAWATAFLFVSVTILRGGVWPGHGRGSPPSGAIRVCLPRLQPLFCVRQLLCLLPGSLLIFTSTPDTHLHVASPLLQSGCWAAANAAG